MKRLHSRPVRRPRSHSVARDLSGCDGRESDSPDGWSLCTRWSVFSMRRRTFASTVVGRSSLTRRLLAVADQAHVHSRRGARATGNDDVRLLPRRRIAHRSDTRHSSRRPPFAYFRVMPHSAQRRRHKPRCRPRCSEQPTCEALSVPSSSRPANPPTAPHTPTHPRLEPRYAARASRRNRSRGGR